MAKKMKFEQAKKFESELGQCMKCGYCTFFCPIYQEEPVEASVARGKHTLIKELLDGKADYSEKFEELLGKCTLCMNCSEHCLFKVKTASVILGVRADKANYQGIRFPYNIVFHWLLPHRTIFGRVLRVASWFQKIFLPRTEGTIRHLSFFLSALGKGRNIPSIAPKFLRQIVPAVSKPPLGVETKMRVGFFSGCMTEFVYPDLGKKIINFLTKKGVEVVLPEGQGCCGAPAYLGAGDFATGRRLADTNIKAFADVDYIITGCATCTSALKDYEKFLTDTPERTESYGKFSEKVKDISQFLVDVLKLPSSSYRVSPELKGLKVTWHDPCHLIRYLGIKEEPRQIIKSLDGLQYEEMIRADWCCGMAGTFSISYYDLSKKIAERKMETIKRSGADIVVTSCPGCIIQLTDNIVRNKMPQKVMHIIELFE
jgi:glycolate oxidase iron-sulfur subunit